jgi:hypothetical protein
VLASEIESQYQFFDTSAIAPMRRYACLLSEAPIYQEALPPFKTRLAALRERYAREVEPIVRQNVQRYLAMYGQRQQAWLAELALNAAAANTTLQIAIAKVHGAHRELEKKYGIVVRPLVVDPVSFLITTELAKEEDHA